MKLKFINWWYARKYSDINISKQKNFQNSSLSWSGQLSFGEILASCLKFAIILTTVFGLILLYLVKVVNQEKKQNEKLTGTNPSFNQPK
jgi:hypothetical protein